MELVFFHFFILGLERESRLGAVSNKVQVCDVFSVAIGNEEVFVPVMIKICKKGAPAPVCCLHAGKLCYFAKRWVTFSIEAVMVL